VGQQPRPGLELDPDRETITLIYESTSADGLQSPDNIVIVPQTGHIFLQENGSGAQFIRGLTRRGEIYDFAATTANETEFCGGTFDPDGPRRTCASRATGADFRAGRPTAAPSCTPSTDRGRGREMTTEHGA
jgi:secreted PhoX family phosphatase